MEEKNKRGTNSNGSVQAVETPKTFFPKPQMGSYISLSLDFCIVFVCVYRSGGDGNVGREVSLVETFIYPLEQGK